MFIAFDVLRVGRHDVRGLPLMRQRAILEDAIADSEMVLPVRRLAGTGARAGSTVERRGLEGFVAKDPASSYRAGPTRSWVKVKLRRESVFVVGANPPRIRGVVWLTPGMRAEISYAEVVAGKLRAPSWRRLMRRWSLEIYAG